MVCVLWEAGCGLSSPVLEETGPRKKAWPSSEGAGVLVSMKLCSDVRWWEAAGGLEASAISPERGSRSEDV